MKKYSIILVASMMATAAMAQKLTPQQEHEFFHKAYEVINTYRKAAPLSDEREEARFMDLYESSDIQVFNDLMGLNYEPTLPVKQYVRLLRDAKRQRVEIRNVRKNKVWVEDGTWLMELRFDKRISFIGLCNTFFDSHRFFKEDYHLMMVLAMEGEGGKCRIRDLKIVGNEDTFRFPTDYKVLVKDEMDVRDDKLQIGRKDGPFANFPNEGQIILREDVPIYYNKAKVLERDVEGACDHKIMADYEDKLWRIRANGAYALSGFNKLGENGGITVTGDDEMAFGLDVGFVFPTKKRFFVGIFAGVGLSKNSLTMEFMPTTDDDLSYNAPSTADEDGDPYIRKYEMIGGKGITQTMNASDIAVPVYLDLEYQFQKISIYADLGVKFQTSTGIMTATTGAYKTWGVYPDYGDLVIGEEGDVTLNGFGTHDEIGIDEEGITKKMAIDALFGLGIRLNLNKSLALDAGIQYQTGGKSWEANPGSIFTYTLEGGDKVNLLRKVGCVRHDALKVAASIIYKF